MYQYLLTIPVQLQHGEKLTPSRAYSLIDHES